MGVTELRSRVLTVCPFCACGCGLYLQSANGRAVGVTPSEHHAVSAGRLCARGWAAHEASLWGPRLTRPLVRNGGGLEPATWPVALRVAANRLLRVAEAGGAPGVLGSGRATNEENFLGARLARGALQSDHVDSCLRALSPAGRPHAGHERARTPGAARGAGLVASDHFLTAHGDIEMAVKAVKAGALDLIQKPFRDQDLLDKVHYAIASDARQREERSEVEAVRSRIASLTPREHELLEMVVAGRANKVIAGEMGIRQRTVEIHRARVMKKMAADSVTDLVRMLMRARPPAAATRT